MLPLKIWEGLFPFEHCIWVTDVFMAKMGFNLHGHRGGESAKNKKGYGCAQDLIWVPSPFNTAAILLFITPTYVEPMFK